MTLNRSNFLEFLTGEAQPLTLSDGMTVMIRPLTLVERERVRLAAMKDGGEVDTVAMEVQTVLAGLAEPRLSDEDVETLRQGRAGVIDFIAKAIMDMSGMGDEDEKKAGAGS